MIRVNIEALVEGMVVAEPILDDSGKVLLADKAMLTKKHIDILKTWSIEFVRIREPHETDDDVKAALKLDREREKAARRRKNVPVTADLGINEMAVTEILRGNFQMTRQHKPVQPLAVPTNSVIKEAPLKCYHDYLQLVEDFVDKRRQTGDMDIGDIGDIAQKVVKYIRMTPGVLGYVLQPLSTYDDRLAAHLLGTSIVAGKIAILLELPEKDLKNIVIGCLLHDIGKIRISEDLWEERADFSAEDRKAYQRHVAAGLEKLKGRKWMSKEVMLLIAQHHERSDGKGFPTGFRGEQIHKYARIAAIADYFEHVTHNMEKPSFNLLQIINELLHAGGRFDVAICENFREYLQNFLLSNKVTLSDGRTAEIVYMHQAFSEPVIRTSDGQFIDLNKEKEAKISNFMV